MPLKHKIFSIKNLDDDICVRREYALRSKINGEELSVVKKSLYKVPGNEFYMYFKRFILLQDFEHRDLLFMENGKIAKWVDFPKSMRIE